jgi:hypothetical protein
MSLIVDAGQLKIIICSVAISPNSSKYGGIGDSFAACVCVIKTTHVPYGLGACALVVDNQPLLETQAWYGAGLIGF